MSVRGKLLSPTVLATLALFLGTLLLYARSAGYDFLNYDDPRYITANPEVREGITVDSLRWAVTGSADLWNPVTRLTHLLDVQLFGLDVRGHHWTSNLWQALNAGLAFLLLRRLTGSLWTSALCAAVFAWHPLRVESVSWISERKDVVSVFFGLLTLLGYTVYGQRLAAGASVPSTRRAYAGTLLAFTAALLSKPSMVALPGVLFLLDFWPLGRLADLRAARLRRLVLEKIPFALLAVVFSVITIHTQTAAKCFQLELPLLARLLNALVSIPRYLGKLFWPFDLAVAYPHPVWWPVWLVAFSVFVVAGISYAAWRLRRSAPWLAVGWLWFLGMLVPVIGLVQVGFQSIADRYTFFPLLGAQIALFWTLRSLLPRVLPRTVIALGSGLLVLGCAARTWDQQSRWHDPVTLFEHAIAVTGPNHTAQGFLAYSLAGLGRAEEARQHAKIALALEPENRTALVTLARLALAERQYESAADTFATVLALDPQDLDTALGRAKALWGLGQPEQVLAQLQPFVDTDNTNLELLQSYAFALIKLGRQAEAEQPILRAIARYPDSPDLHVLHATVLDAAGRPDQAIEAFAGAVALTPDDPALLLDHARFLVRHNRTDQALDVYARLARLRPESALPRFEAALLCLNTGSADRGTALLHDAIAAEPAFAPARLTLAQQTEAAGNTAEADRVWREGAAAIAPDADFECARAEALARRRDFPGALEHYRKATGLAPNNAQAHAGLGYMLMLTGDRAGALAAWEQALRLQPDFPGLAERVRRMKTSR